MSSQQPTHHGYAVNVKDHTLYGDHSPLSDTEAQQVYDAVAERFWHDADLIAHDHGFPNGVYAEGRMGGWCVPQPQPRTDDMWDHEVAAWVAKKFRPFEAAIRDLLSVYRDEARTELAAAIDKAKREPAEAAHWAARDTITVDA